VFVAFDITGFGYGLRAGGRLGTGLVRAILRPREHALWFWRNFTAKSVLWDNVRLRMNRLLHGQRNNPRIDDVAMQWHHGVMPRWMLNQIEGPLRRVSPRLADSIARFAHGHTKLLTPAMHAMADRLVTPQAGPWYLRGRYNFNPYRTWLGTDDAGRALMLWLAWRDAKLSFALGSGLAGDDPESQ
jgi:hypothetical protein